MSILSSISSMVSPLIVDRVAASIGINSGLARTAINLALPAVLNAFASKAATPAGATALHNAVAGANPNLFGSLDSLLSGDNRDQFVKSGTATLNNLLGSNAVGQLAGTIGSNSGISSNVSSMLLPMVGQMALSGIAKSASGMDARGLAQMLAGTHTAGVATGTHRTSEEAITRTAVKGTTTTTHASAMHEVSAAESRHGNGAEGRPEIREVKSESSSAKAEMPKVDIPKRPDMPKVDIPKAAAQHVVAQGSGGMGWLRWVLPLLAALAALWWYVSGRDVATPVAEQPATTEQAPASTAQAPAATTEQAPATTAQAPATTTEQAPATTTAQAPAATTELAPAIGALATGVVIDGVDVNKSLGDVFTGLAGTLGTVTDATTAQAALPKLQEYGMEVDKIAAVAAKFSPEQKTVVGGLITAGLPAVRAAADKALAGAGVGDLLKPVVDGMFAKIEGLAK